MFENLFWFMLGLLLGVTILIIISAIVVAGEKDHEEDEKIRDHKRVSGSDR